MNDVLFLLKLHIIILENNTNTSLLDSIDAIINIAIGIISIIGGLLGIFLLKTLREKNLNATLGYFSRLKVHIHLLKSTFDNYHTEILYRFIPENSRVDSDHTKSSFISDIICNFSNEASDTLTFLKNEDNQMPADNNWMAKYDILLDFLEDMKQIKQCKFYKFDMSDDFDEIADEYYKKHSENLSNMLKSIENHQNKIQNKLYKKNKKA